jgi:hypothetical protein
LKNPNMVFHDDLYGDVTHSGNVLFKPSNFEKSLPYIAALISMGAPLAAGALAAGGVGLGAAGATSAVTGGAAGLGAGSIPGALGAGTFAGTAPWWVKPAVRAAPGLLNTTHNYAGDVWAPPIGGSAPKTGAPPIRTASNESSLVANDFADDPYGFGRRGF